MQIYIHIPICKKKCLYCDFNSYANCSHELIFRYLTALNREIELAGHRFSDAEDNLKITSIFIGGGTPSLLEKNELESVVKSVKNSFNLSEDLEFTIEANPE
ncbi:MAG: coproporphyrinogen III oxidase, partial [Clostridia bacterium]|nr:coproporphyrinogen III oxidase [Clostridia bacterium]